MSHSVKNIEIGSSLVTILWDTKVESKFHYIWLRDHCHCSECYHPLTRQRLQNTYDIPDDIKAVSYELSGDRLIFNWNHQDHKSEFNVNWLFLNSYCPVLILQEDKIKNESSYLKLELWDVAKIETELPRIDYLEIMSSDEGIKKWVLKIWKYGFCLVDNVPESPECTQDLIEKISFIRPTHYGGFWDFTSDLNVNDTAYTDIAIPLHTDGTYFTDPPGLQLFHLLKHTGTGGITTLCDSFHCAKLLQLENPEYYEILSKFPIPTHSAGEENVFIQPSYPRPILNHNYMGELIQVRWNISDRSTLNLPLDDPELQIPLFYKATKRWNELLESNKNEFYHTLKPGQCLIFDNWRVLHSRRTKFTGQRRMCGAYINRDDFTSRVKLLNLDREDILATI
ncbi:hypothetical protein PACTADRAFT_75344 [Pachysolen tannophilus NRRL Y-2460]|uniref:Trimethyllysine dioxygenase n=1 Tax=Pachysolen tannophilus NRRL Y-2460 TaxID=669874 RepID=A0A1E4TWL0_PACTA|nr:hypothetical protein PACTADRAFT_75344 [Pachysolen tannophilus NRRL Y-2460]